MFEAYLAELPVSGAQEQAGHIHEGAELLYVVEGALALRYSGEEVRPAAGDSVYFDSSEPHSYRGAGQGGARAVVVAVSPLR